MQFPSELHPFGSHNERILVMLCLCPQPSADKELPELLLSRFTIETPKLHLLEENIGAVYVELSPDDLRDIHDAASKITLESARYPENLEKMTGR